MMTVRFAGFLDVQPDCGDELDDGVEIVVGYAVHLAGHPRIHSRRSRQRQSENQRLINSVKTVEQFVMQGQVRTKGLSVVILNLGCEFPQIQER